MYEDVKIEKCEAEIEKGFAKLRWSRWNERGGQWGRKHAYDVDEKKLNFKNLRPTEMKYNKRVYLPDPMSEEEEMEAMHLKNELMKEIEQYCKENKNKMSMCNLSKNEKKDRLERNDISI